MKPTFEQGALVAARFRIVRFVAQGGMGEVYEAEDTELGERVALKVLSRQHTGDPDLIRRFRREVQLARRVTHPNVCRLFDVYRHRVTEGLHRGTDAVFVTMELLAGETLEAKLGRDGPMSESEALPLAVQMAAALSAAHHAGIVHRDFKAGNVMLVPEGTGVRVVVTDFGLARLRDAKDEDEEPITTEMRLVGTPDSMAPEQLRGGVLTEAADIYGFGVVLFEMVTAAKPYEAANAMALLVRRVSEAPRRVRDVAPTVSAAWDEVVAHCLAQRPEDRPASVEAVVTALGADVSSLRLGTLRTGPAAGSSRPTGSAAAGSGPDGAGGSAAKGATAAHATARTPWRGSAMALAALVFVLLAVVIASRRPVSGPATSIFLPEQLTTEPGLELDPSFSPDGQALVYSAVREGRFVLVVRDLAAGGRETQLTFGDGQAFEPAWSPDGTTIAFHDAEQGGLWLVAATGGEPRRLTVFGSRPAWSPDGRQLVFQSESRPALADTAVTALGRSQIWRVDVRGGDPEAVTEIGAPSGGHGAPTYSPDGRRLVFTASQRGSSEIWTVAADGGDLRRLVDTPETCRDPVFSPRGDAILFSASVRQVHGLWRLGMSPRSGEPTGPPEPIANLGLASIRQLAIAARGDRIAYAALSTYSNLWSLPLDPATGEVAGEATALTRGGARNNRPAFSPDGSEIVFDAWRLGVDIDLWVMGSDGGDPRQVTADPWISTSASWFPDGVRLAYTALRDDERALLERDLRSAEVRELLALPADADWVRLSPDGGRIAYHSRGRGDRSNIHVQDLEGGAVRQITQATSFAGFPVWSPDGRWIAYQRRSGDASHVTVVASDGGEPRQLTFGDGQSWPFSFSPDGDRVYFAGQRDEGWNLWWVSRSSGQSARLTDLGGLTRYVRYPAASPGGDRVVYELAETVGDIWLVSDFLGTP